MAASAVFAQTAGEDKKPPGKVETPQATTTLYGGIDFNYIIVDKDLVTAANAISTGSSTGSAIDYLFGNAWVKMVSQYESVTATLNITTKRFDPTASSEPFKQVYAFGGDTNNPVTLFFREASLSINDFPFKLPTFAKDMVTLDATVQTKVGLMNVAQTLRPTDGAFFIDLQNSESSLSGINTAGTQVTNFIQRDQLEPAGMKIEISDQEFFRISMLGIKTVERLQGLPRDQRLIGMVMDVTPSAVLKFINLITWDLGGLDSGQNVWTFGLGSDWYPDWENKTYDIFAQAYFQRGNLRRDSDDHPHVVQKRAWGGQIGFTYYKIYNPTETMKKMLWFEGAVEYRSGDNGPSDAIDKSFQSFENVDVPLIMQSNDVGLDLDTNLFIPRVSIGYNGIYYQANRPLDIRFDLARGYFPAKNYFRDGNVMYGGGVIGDEADISFTVQTSSQSSVSLRLGYLFNSGLIQKMSGTDNTYATMLGFKFTW